MARLGAGYRRVVVNVLSGGGHLAGCERGLARGLGTGLMIMFAG